MSYEPYGCPIRYGLSIFGDRWSLLIIRDLMFKGKRFYKDFAAAGEGISTNILADRLERLEVSGVISKSPDPEHGKRYIYALTQKGVDLLGVMLAIMDWAEKYDEYTEIPREFARELSQNRAELENNIRANFK